MRRMLLGLRVEFHLRVLHSSHLFLLIWMKPRVSATVKAEGEHRMTQGYAVGVLVMLQGEHRMTPAEAR